MQALEDLLGAAGIGHLDGPLQDDRPRVDALVDEMHGDPEHGHAVLDRLLDGSQARERR